MREKKLQKVIFQCMCLIIILMALLPILYIACHSLKRQEFIRIAYLGEGFKPWEHLFIQPFRISLEQYSNVFLKTPKFLYLFWNSLWITLPIVVGQMFVGLLAAYAFAKLKYRGSEKIFYMNMIMMLMPFQVTLVPHYIVLSRLKLIDHYGSLILSGIFSCFSVFFLKQFIEGIDETYLEEARLLGASEWRILWSVILPMCKPVVVSSSTLLFLDYWNMVDQPIHFLSQSERYPLSIYLAKIIDKNIGIGFACSMLYMLLPILVTLYAQEDLTTSMRLGSLK